MDDCGNGLLAPAGAEKAFIAAACSLAWQHRHLDEVRERARRAALRANWTDALARFETHLAETVGAHAAATAAGAALAA